MERSRANFLFTLIVLVMIVASCALFITIKIAFKQADLQAANREISWTYRQGIFHRYSNALSWSEHHPENDEARLLLKVVRERIQTADNLLNKDDVVGALPLLRSAGYETERVESFLTCGQITCEK